jgi:hypothetical protein
LPYGSSTHLLVGTAIGWSLHLQQDLADSLRHHRDEEKSPGVQRPGAFFVPEEGKFTMSDDRLVATAERCSAWLIGTTSVAAGYLLLASLSDWRAEGGSLLRVLPVSGWLHWALVAAAVVAFVFCIGVMLITVTAEARRLEVLRDSREREYRTRQKPSCLHGRTVSSERRSGVGDV